MKEAIDKLVDALLWALLFLFALVVLLLCILSLSWYYVIQLLLR